MDFREKLIRAVKTCLINKYFTTTGRATRTEFWIFFLFYVFLAFFGTMAGFSTIIFIPDPMSALIVMLIFYGLPFLTIPPFIAVAIRRLHDVNKPWWFVIFIVIPFLNLITIIFLAQKGNTSENKYGSVPQPYV